MRRSTVLATAAALSATLALAGCGSSGGDKAARKQAGPAADGQDINVRPLSDLKQGGSLRIGIEQWITQYNINQVDGQQGDAQSIISLVLPDLFTSDAKGAHHLNKDFLTSAKVVSTSPQVVEYELNPKARWSDGKPLSWRDFAAQWKALNGSDPAYEAVDTSGYDQISRVGKGKGEHGVRVTFDKPYADWQRLFDPLYPAAYIDSPKKFNSGWADRTPVSGGAFKLGTYDRTGQTITAVPDPKWWGARPKLDSIVFRVMDTRAKTDAYLNNEIDYTNAILPEDYKRLAKAKNTDIRRGARWDEVHITFNGAHGALKDVRVRNALQAAIDRKGINTSFAKDLGFELRTLDSHFFMPNQEGYRKNSGSYATYDPGKAKKLLDAAGWKGADGATRSRGGQKLVLDYVLDADAVSSAVDQAQIVQQQLGAVGVRVDIKKVPANDFFNKYVNTGNFDLVSFRNVDQVYLSMAYATYRQPRGRNLFQNFGSVGSPKVDELLTKAARTTDRTESVRLYNEADREIWKLGHSFMLYQRPQVYAVRAGLANFGAEGLADRDYLKVGWVK
ncbi:ABC transporter family substrate-binding protein [Streptomyces sp. NPDC002564]|uniref:ABC transporter family substrate-binding protein n=1 Tax=Streptomyces sp. NPDC002564 TaxID=3364649 RepID=UPI00368363EB